jgi:PTH1 family peptidyl-tRNA hydrolase
MKIIVGLGNPGKEYENTRHNIGFRVVDELLRKFQMPNVKFQTNAKFKAQIFQANNLLFVKPNTFMNKSGEAVRKIADFYKIKAEDTWVIHDDLDITIGDYKVNFGKGPKVHNGVESVEKNLGTKEFWRVRVGTDNRTDRAMPGEAYVLQAFTEIEMPIINATIEKIVADLYGRIV